MSGKQSGGYKDTGLPSLIHQPIGLDRIHQLPRIHRLILFFLLSSYMAFSPPLSLYMHPCLPTCSLTVSQFSLSFCRLFAPTSPLLPSLFPSFLPVCNVERWWIDMCWCTEEPIWTGVSAHLYQMLQRYILWLCFITLEWRALKCLTALSSLLRPSPPPTPHLLAPSPTSLSLSFSGCELYYWSSGVRVSIAIFLLSGWLRKQPCLRADIDSIARSRH